ncbi:MAG: subclass B3 metallo-beta-lactamase [Gemmatimonadaceae bacterium]
MIQLSHVVAISFAAGAELFNAGALSAQNKAAAPTTAQTKAHAAECPSCAEWNAAQKPFRVFGNTWYVGTHGLGALLVTSTSGHVLVDAGLPESAPLIAANIAALGFRIKDVKLIVNSHAHFDHAGGMAELQRLSGARVVALPPSAWVLQRGESGDDDPQYGLGIPFAKVQSPGVVEDNETIKGGEVSVTAHKTAGHTPGGTTWSWVSCEGERCLNMVYADSQTPVSADSFFYTRTKTYPNGLADFENGFRSLDAMPCDILLTPHPDASGLWQRVAARDSGRVNALVDTMACKRYADGARKRLATRIATETSKP